MKIRNGFVSNSSSSSFIIGIVNATRAGVDKGFVFDPNTAEYNSWLENLFISTDTSYKEASIEKINNEEYKITIESFTDVEVSCIAKPGDKILTVAGTGPDDDSFFWEEGGWEYDYDKISLDDFDDTDIELYKEILRLGGECTLGAGRDG